MMSYLLQGHIAVVTGAGSGIGQGIAVGYAVEGARVIAVDINEAGAVETVAMIDKAGGDAVSYKLDVTDAAACRALADTVSRDIWSSVGAGQQCGYRAPRQDYVRHRRAGLG
jgi:NAD(P)-dependent dehydrogenase (short-subunit alcohol dehydrogenase family)